MQAAGIDKIAVAQLDLGDVAEDEAAARASRNLVGSGTEARAAGRGRVNLCALSHGVFHFETAVVDRLNRIDESITIATLPLHEVVAPGQLVATVKVNPYAVPESSIQAWEAVGKHFAVAAFRPRRVSLIQTSSMAIKDKVHEKTTAVTTERLQALGSSLVASIKTAHESQTISAAIRSRLKPATIWC